MAIQSKFYKEEDLFHSDEALRHGWDNTEGATPAVRENLQRLVRQILDPICGISGVTFHLNSVYRCPTVNAHVGGDPKSAHMDGRAADVKITGASKEKLKEVFDAIRKSKIPFDKIIFECDSWIHLQIAKENITPRRIAMLASGGPGNWHYYPAPELA